MLTGAGFREVVFNAMQSDTRGPSSSDHPHATMTAVAPNERRHDGGSYMNTVVSAQLQTESSFAASSSSSSHSTTSSSHAGGSLSVISTPFERHQESRCVGSVIDAQLRADATSPSTRNYAVNPSRDMTSDPLLTAILNNQQQQHAPLAPTSMTASQQEPADTYDPTYLGVNATRRTVADMTARSHSHQQQRGALNGSNDTVSRQTTLTSSATDSSSSNGTSSSTHTSYSELGATSHSRRQSNAIQRRGPQGHVASSSPKKRVLPSMSPIQQLQHQSIPYHLRSKTAIDNDSLISNYGNNNNNNAVDFSASYTMTSYASDPRIATANSLPPHAAHAVNMRLTPVTTRSKHEPNAAYNDAADSSAPSL
uniref:Uncharacterized protein n=1 Tax=Globisporangium ultimum (strain ATCC 200006 / CBS 805.95 / DAOM BR144) TaxID=431595 RepID=K3WT72_GLOUD